MLSYLELIEVAFVASFRSLGVPMELIRFASDRMALKLESERPSAAKLVHGHPFAAHYFEEIGVGALEGMFAMAPSSVIRARAPGNTAWPSALESKFAEFDYDHDYGIAVRWHLAGRKSGVAIDPRIAFGYPMVAGLPTWVLEDRRGAGESLSEISDDFRIGIPLIEDALTFERLYSTSNDRKR